MIQLSLIYIKPTILVQYARVLVSVTQDHVLISSLCNTGLQLIFESIEKAQWTE